MIGNTSDAPASRPANGGPAPIGRNGVPFGILAVAAVLIAIMAASAGYGIYQMRQIGGGISEIAEHDLPLTGVVARVTEHQLEQAIAFQRSLRYGAEMRTDPAKRLLFDRAVARFEALAARTDAEFAEAGAMVAKFIAEQEEGRQLTEFLHAEAKLASLGKAHAAYEEHARAVLVALRRGGTHAARRTIEDVEAEEAKLDKDLEELLDRLKAFTLESARIAKIGPGRIRPENMAA